jgi:hypothetical protein
MEGSVAGQIQRIGRDLWLMKLKGDSRLGKDRAGIFDNSVFREFNDIEVEEGRGLVPYQVIDGLIAIGGVFEIAGVYGCDSGFVANGLEPKGRMGKKDDNGVSGMDMSRGGVVHRDLPFQQPVVMVFLYNLMMGLPADGKLGFQAGGDQKDD